MIWKDAALMLSALTTIFFGVLAAAACPVPAEYHAPIALAVGIPLYLVLASLVVRWTAPANFDASDRLWLVFLFPMYVGAGLFCLLVWPLARIVDGRR